MTDRTEFEKAKSRTLGEVLGRLDHGHTSIDEFDDALVTRRRAMRSTHQVTYMENERPETYVGSLRQIHKKVGTRYVILDGHPGRFEFGDDEHAQPVFVRDEADG